MTNEKKSSIRFVIFVNRNHVIRNMGAFLIRKKMNLALDGAVLFWPIRKYIFNPLVFLNFDLPK